MAIVSVVVAINAPYLLSALTGTTVAAGSATAVIGGAALANVASQLTGNILGVQSGFNFGSFATSVITAGIGELGPVKAFTNGLSGAVGNALGNSAAIAARAVVGNVIGQGVGIITGQQKGFSWSSVAVSAISAPLASKVNEKLLGGSNPLLGSIASNPIAAQTAAGLVSSGVQELTRVAIQGGKINWVGIASSTAQAFTSAALTNSIAQQRLAQGNTNAVKGNGTGINLSKQTSTGIQLTQEQEALVFASVDRQSSPISTTLDSATNFTEEDFSKFKLNTILGGSNLVEKTLSFSSIEELNVNLGGYGRYGSSAAMVKALALQSGELQDLVRNSGNVRWLGSLTGVLGLTDSIGEIGMTVSLPYGRQFASLGEMIDPDTHGLLSGYSMGDLSARAKQLGLQMHVQSNGITNSPNQAYSNSLSLSLELELQGKNAIIVSAYNPTHGTFPDLFESVTLKLGVETASSAATREMIKYAVSHNIELADLKENSALAYTQVWGHSEGSILVTQATLSGLDKNDLRHIDMRVFGTAVGVAPAGLHSYIAVSNKNDFVVKWAGTRLTSTGGVANSAAFIAANKANPGSYQFVESDFVVSQNGMPAKGEFNHSWQYYMVDPTTRSAFGLAPLDVGLKSYYDRSMWIPKE